jgi:hypothetical protein
VKKLLGEIKMERNQIVEFLIKAKRATYAGKGPEIASSRPKSRDLAYSEGDLTYIDTYLGAEKFAGEEALWENEMPFWAMNYCGRVLSSDFEGDFLKEALYQVPKENPFRGPKEYKSGNFIYKCHVNGAFEWFTGYEEIYHGETKVYECMFHGGLIK